MWTKLLWTVLREQVRIVFVLGFFILPGMSSPKAAAVLLFPFLLQLAFLLQYEYS